MEASRKVVLNPSPETIDAFIKRINEGATSRANRDAILNALLQGLPRGAVINTMDQRPGQRPQ
jgi:hypothetical protein